MGRRLMQAGSWHGRGRRHWRCCADCWNSCRRTGPLRALLGGVDITHQLLHFVQWILQHQYVVLGQQQRCDLAQPPDGWSVGVRHYLTQAIQGWVQIVHPLALPGVDLESQLLQLLLRQVPLGDWNAPPESGSRTPDLSSSGVPRALTAGFGRVLTVHTRWTGAFFIRIHLHIDIAVLVVGHLWINVYDQAVLILWMKIKQMPFGESKKTSYTKSPRVMNPVKQVNKSLCWVLNLSPSRSR